MTDFRRVTDAFSVAPQIGPDDVTRAAKQGFVLLINNRPDGEDFAQTDGSVMAAAAEDAGLSYLYIPIRGGPTREQALAQSEAVASAGGPVLAYCRSGTRSINTWALGERLAGRARDELVELGAGAGYDLSGLP